MIQISYWKAAIYLASAAWAGALIAMGHILWGIIAALATVVSSEAIERYVKK